MHRLPRLDTGVAWVDQDVTHGATSTLRVSAKTRQPYLIKGVGHSLEAYAAVLTSIFGWPAKVAEA